MTGRTPPVVESTTARGGALMTQVAMPPAARPQPEPEPVPEGHVRLTIDGVSVIAPKGELVIRDRRADRHRDPAVLRPPAAGAGRRLPAVPGRGGDGRPADAQAAGLLHPDRRRRHGGQDPAELAGRREGAALQPGVPAAEPPAGLPDLRQGRRVPAAEPGAGQRFGALPAARPEAGLRQADRGLHRDPAGPRTLRAVPALHPVLRPDRRRQVHRPAGARLRAADRHQLGRAVPVVLLRQHHPDLPGRRADLGRLPVPGPAVRPGLHRHRLRALRRRLRAAHRPPGRRGHPPAGPHRPGRQRGLELRQGPVRLRVRPRGRPDHPAADPRRRRRAAAGVLDRGDDGRRAPAC